MILQKLKGAPSCDFHGVAWVTKPQKWGAYVDISGRHTLIGTFENAVQAAKVYDAAVKRLGE